MIVFFLSCYESTSNVECLKEKCYMFMSVFKSNTIVALTIEFHASMICVSNNTNLCDGKMYAMIPYVDV